MKTYLFRRTVTRKGETVEEFRAVCANDYQDALRRAGVDVSWELLSESEDIAIYTRRSVVEDNATNPLLRPLQDLVNQIDLSKLNVRKDFSLLNVHACATKALHNFLS